MNRKFQEFPDTAPASAPALAHSIENAAKRLGIGRTMVFKLIGDGRLKAVRMGQRTLVPETSLVEFLASLDPVMPENRSWSPRGPRDQATPAIGK